MKRHAAVALVARWAEGRDALVVCCNGMIGRELFAAADRPEHFYMIGSMGLASSIGLGIALGRPEREIVVLDGDGNVLMGAGALCSVAALSPGKFRHVILDNEAHGSTGDQKTISATVDLLALARGAGYRWTARADDAASLDRALGELGRAPAPACLLVKVEKGNLPGVPRVEHEPPAIAERFGRAVRRGP